MPRLDHAPSPQGIPNRTEQPLSFSVSTFSLFPLPLGAALPVIAAAGLENIELVAPPLVNARVAARIARLARAHGVAIRSVHQTLFGYGPALPLTRRMADAVELALALQAPLVVVHSPHTRDWDEPAARQWLSVLVRLRERTAQAGTTLSIENVDWDPAQDEPVVLAQLGDLAAFAAAHGLGITFDTCHAARSGADLLASYALLRPHLVNVHLSDRRSIGRGERSFLRRTLTANHRLPGEGDVALDGLLACLAADGYAGPVTLEVNPWALRPWSPASCRRVLERTIAHCQRAALGRGAQG